MNIAPTMFGNTDAARNLTDMLTTEANPLYLRKVGRFLTHNSSLIKTLTEIPNPNHRRGLAKMLRENIVNTNMELPEKIKTHAINVAVGNLRRAMEQWDQKPDTGGCIVLQGNEFDFIVDDKA